MHGPHVYCSFNLQVSICKDIDRFSIWTTGAFYGQHLISTNNALPQILLYAQLYLLNILSMYRMSEINIISFRFQHLYNSSLQSGNFSHQVFSEDYISPLASLSSLYFRAFGYLPEPQQLLSVFPH